MNNANAPNNQAKKSLKNACTTTGARWAVWIKRAAAGWVPSIRSGLSPSQLNTLQGHLDDQKTTTWLAGALTGQRTRWKALNELSSALHVTHLFAYPAPNNHQILLVGSDKMEHTADLLFRYVAAYTPIEVSPETNHPPPKVENHVLPFEAILEASYDPQVALDSILEHLASHITCEAAYLAIRYGDSFQVQATWNSRYDCQGVDIPLVGNVPIQQIIASAKGTIFSDYQHYLHFPHILDNQRSWLGIPIIFGRQIIGLAAFASTNTTAFSRDDIFTATQHVNQLANNVESVVIFSEATRYLQQLALLNDLASTAALGVETESSHPGDDFARRVMVRLRREFATDWAAVLLLSEDRSTLQESGGGTLSSPPWIVPVKGSLMGQAVESGLPIRVNDLTRVMQYYPLRNNIRSELAVPLKYRGVVIGALVLVSESLNAFTIQDEQLLVVIASHLAGLFENVRLNDETRERARSLADSVRQLEAVRDTSLDLAGDLDLSTLLKRVARRARDLVGARGAELGLLSDTEHVVEIVVSDTPWEKIQGMKIPLMAGVAGQLAAFGEPIVVQDYHHWPGRLSPERATPYHAVAGVPLKFKGQVIGTLTVLDDRPEKSFKASDVQLLELLAPQAAISIRNASLYQELEERIQAQRLAESRLIRSARLAAVGEMAAGVAHELNNPLTTVTGFVELAIDGLPTESPLRSDLELVLQEAHRARGVVRRLLDFSRPVDDQRTRSDVNDLVNQVLPLFHHLARTSGINMKTTLAENLPWISIDPNQIKQVLINLIHNAIQAMPDGGELTITSHNEQRHVPDRSLLQEQEGSPSTRSWICIRVTDTGVGISQDILERIFEPFFSTRPAGTGTGLGLSVSYGIIASHGGWIEVDSQPGQGSSFYIFLPILEE